MDKSIIDYTFTIIRAGAWVILLAVPLAMVLAGIVFLNVYVRKELSMEDEIKLADCPFCGSNNIAIRFETVCCRECDASMSGSAMSSAIEDWNRRTNQMVALDQEEIRKWWRFDNNQQPLSTWHEREDFIEKYFLPASRKVSLNIMEKVAVDAINKEQLRNGITLPTHQFSEICSCGRCHTATIVAQAIKSAIESGSVYETN